MRTSDMDEEDFDDVGEYGEYEEPPRRRRHSGRGLAWFLVLVILAAAVWFIRGQQPVRETESAGTRESGRCTILIAGTDKEGYRTDTIMLLSLDAKARKASLLSIPRDTYVKDSPYSVPKINSACGYAGGGKDGMEELMTQVSKLLGFMPDGYALVDLDAFVQTVDLMGGVDFDVPMDMQYSDPSQGLDIDLKKGMQHLDGSQAIQLVRFRSGYAMADLTRTQVQRDFVKAAIKQWATPKNIVRLPALVGIIRDKMTTDLSSRNVMWLGRVLLGCRISDMETDTLPGSPQYIGRGAYYVADPEKVQALMVQSYSPYR